MPPRSNRRELRSRLEASPPLRASREARFLAAEAFARKEGFMASTVAVIRHPVSDFDAWKHVYDEFGSVQAEHGVRAHQVLRSIDDPNQVIVTHTFDSPEAARAFFAMAELKDAMS